MQETQVQSLGREDLLEKEMATHSSILAWKFHGQWNLVGYSPWVAKSRTRLSDFISKDFHGGSDGKVSVYNAGDLDLIAGSGRSPEKEMATHSSIVAWRIPWTEQPGGL